LSTTKRTWSDPGSNLGRRGGQQTTNRPSYLLINQLQEFWDQMSATVFSMFQEVFQSRPWNLTYTKVLNFAVSTANYGPYSHLFITFYHDNEHAMFYPDIIRWKFAI
jgi:hypothetical protein